MSTGATDELGSGGRFLMGQFLYNRAAAMITLRNPDDTLANNVGSTEQVTVRVTYLYYCGLPIVSQIMCRTLSDLSGLDIASEAVASTYDDVTSGNPSRVLQANDTFRDGLQAAGERFAAFSSELEHAAAPELLVPLLFTKARFKVLHAEATLPNQGACYYSGSSCFAGESEL